MIGQQAEVGIVIGPRSEEVVPRVVEPHAVIAIDEVSGEERVGPLILYLHYERVVFGAVIGVVERRGHRVFVGGVRLAVGIGWQERHIFGDAGAPRAVARARGVAEKDAGPRSPRRHGLGVGDHHAYDRIAIGAELGIDLQFGRGAGGGSGQLERHGGRRREIVRAQLRAVGAGAKRECRHDVGRQHGAK